MFRKPSKAYIRGYSDAAFSGDFDAGNTSDYDLYTRTA